MLHLEYRFLRCCNLDASESRSEIAVKFEMWFWRRLETISWTDHVRNEEVLQRFKEESNVLRTIKGSKDN